MSDSRCCFKLQGKGWREVLAKGSPADVSKESFSLGVLRRTRIDNVAVAFWMVNLNDIRVMCMRSFGDFLEDWFENAARSSQSIDYF